jgi:SprT protein
MTAANDLSQCPKLFRRWARRWNAVDMAEQITCQWSPRLRSSLGRAYPLRMLVRLNVLLQEPRFALLFEEVLCHEAAHIAAYHLHGLRVATHGLEWQELVRLGGFEPRRGIQIDDQLGPAISTSEVYVHRCPVCQATRNARRPQPRWRCVACQNSGLEGKLIIRRHLSRREAVDA